MDKTGHSGFHVRGGPVTSGSTSEAIFFSLCRAHGPFDTYPCLFVCFTHHHHESRASGSSLKGE